MPPVKKILFFVPCTPYFPSGIVRVEQFLSLLEKDGYAYELLNMIHPRSQMLLERLDRSAWGKQKITDFVIRVAIHLVFLPYQYLQMLKVAAQANKFDIIFIQSNLMPAPIVDFIQRKNPRIIYDFDDAVFLRNQARAIHIISKAWKVFAGSHYNLDFARRHNPASILIPSAVDLAEYPPLTANPERSDPIRIGWIGGASTLKYLRHLVAPLENLARKGYHLQFLITGSRGSEKLIPRVEGVELKVIEEYTHAEIPSLADKMDIGVMPLDDGPWEKGKCGLKLLIYMAAGKPCLSSPVGENQIIIRDGENGFLASSAQEWEQQLEALISNPDLYQRIARQGRKTVEEHYSVMKVYEMIRAELVDA